MKISSLSPCLALGLLASIGLGSAVAAESPYKLAKTIDLPGDKGGHGDWVTYDPDTRTVWLSQSPDHNVVVIDTASNTVKATIPGIEEGNGIAVGPKYAYLSDNKGGVTVVVDKRTFQKVSTLKPAGKGPNGTTYDPKTGTVFVSTDSDDMTVFKGEAPFDQVATFKILPETPKDGPDVALYVASKNRLYQPVVDKVVVIDPAQNKPVETWTLAIKGAAKPLVYDAKRDQFIIGTTDHKMLVLDSGGKTTGSIPVQGAVDETAIDEGARRAFVGDKAGVIEVIDLDRNAVVATLPSEKNVHSLTVDPQSHAVYVYRNESNKVDVFVPANPS